MLFILYVIICVMSENGTEFTDTVDPRVQIELERLNNATDNINKLEVDLDEARASFRELLCESSMRVESLKTKLGVCVEKSKPYYESRFCANEALRQTQIAAMRYERANSAHSAAREMVYLAEQGLGGRTLDHAWQEMLNHATQRVNEAEKERGIAGMEHRAACARHELATTKVQQLQKELKRSIAKSRPYYEMKAHFNQLLESQRSKIQKLESQVCNAKCTYSDALRNLEKISDEIHCTRNKSNPPTTKEDSTESVPDFPYEQQEDEFMSIPTTLNIADNQIVSKLDEISGYRNLPSPATNSEKSKDESSEWTEINLNVNSPEKDVGFTSFTAKPVEKAKLTKQKTLPITDSEISNTKVKSKLDSSIVSWISRSSAKSEQDDIENASRRRSLDNILGPTGEKVKEILSQGIMMLNINSLNERRNSEPRSADDKSSSGSLKKMPSPLDKTLTYLTKEDDNSDSESLASVDMLSEDQINSLMLDMELNDVCEQVLGSPISEVLPKPNFASSSQQPK